MHMPACAQKTAPTANGRSLPFLLIPSTTYQHMRPLLRKEPVSIYLHTCFGAATQEGFSIYPTRTASQLTRLSVTFRKYVLAPSSSFKIDDNYFNHSIRICQQFLIIFSNSFFELSFSCPLLCSIHPHLSTYMPLI